MNGPIVTEISRRSMATEFAILLPGEAQQDTEIALDALEQLDDIEQRLTVFRPDSEISRLNQAAGQQPVPISALLMDVLTQCNRWSELTDGAFDATAGPLVEAWGFMRRRGKKPSASEQAAALKLVDYRKLLLDHQAQTAQLAEPGMQVNLGAIGKGFAVDQIAAYLRRHGLDHFLVHGGKSTVLTSSPAGDSPTAEDTAAGSPPWKIGIEHPLRPTIRLDEIELHRAALATSSSGKQFFHHRGKRFGHVIDPRSGKPAGDWMSLTLICDSAAEADALSTACFVMGREATAAWLNRRLAERQRPDGIDRADVNDRTTVRQIIGIRESQPGENDWHVEHLPPQQPESGIPAR